MLLVHTISACDNFWPKAEITLILILRNSRQEPPSLWLSLHTAKASQSTSY